MLEVDESDAAKISMFDKVGNRVVLIRSGASGMVKIEDPSDDSYAILGASIFSMSQRNRGTEVSLSVVEDVSLLKLSGPDGSDRVSLSSDGHSGSLSLGDFDDNHIHLESSKDLSQLMMGGTIKFDEDGKVDAKGPKVWLTVVEQMPCLMLFGPSGDTSAILAASKTGSALAVRNLDTKFKCFGPIEALIAPMKANPKIPQDLSGDLPPQAPQ